MWGYNVGPAPGPAGKCPAGPARSSKSPCRDRAPTTLNTTLPSFPHDFRFLNPVPEQTPDCLSPAEHHWMETYLVSYESLSVLVMVMVSAASSTGSPINRGQVRTSLCSEIRAAISVVRYSVLGALGVYMVPNHTQPHRETNFMWYPAPSSLI